MCEYEPTIQELYKCVRGKFKNAEDIINELNELGRKMQNDYGYNTNDILTEMKSKVKEYDKELQVQMKNSYGGKSRQYKKKPKRTAKKSRRQRKQTRKRTRKH